MKFWLSDEFKRLQKEWNDRLSRTGFSDIEKTMGGDRVLKQSARNIYRQIHDIEREAKVAYYDLMSHHFRRENFKNPRDPVVIGAYIEGLKSSQIIERCNQFGLKVHRHTIRYTIRRYECKWGIREWTEKKQNLKKKLVTV